MRHISSIVTNFMFNQLRVIFTNTWNKKLWVYILLYYSFYLAFTNGTCFIVKGGLIIKYLPTFNFLIQEINKYYEYTQSSTRKIFYEQNDLFDLDIFSSSLIFCTRNYIQSINLHTFRLIIKYLQIFKIFIEEIIKYCKFSLF